MIVSVKANSELCERPVDASSFFTRSLAFSLTHLTADIAFFTPLHPSESDYEKWKSVFNVIQGLEEVKYFVCVREKAEVFGRFSSLKPLVRALSAVIKMKAPSQREKMDRQWADEILALSLPVGCPELSAPSSVTSCSGIKLEGGSWCNQLWKKLCCLK